MIDTHCHLHLEAFDHNRDEIINYLLNSHGRIITVGTSIEDSKKAIQLSLRYSNLMYCSVGIHPHEVSHEDYGVDTMREYIELAQSPQVKALGEMGFDFYYSKKEDVYELQRDFFLCQIHIAQDLNKPIIIHTRESFQETYDLLSEFSGLTVILHCFTGDTHWVEQFLSLPHTMYFSFSGIITFKHGTDEIVQAIEHVPSEALLIETDAPYLAPVPMRGKQNLPNYLPYIAAKVAEVRKIDIQNLENQLDSNARRAFRI